MSERAGQRTHGGQYKRGRFEGRGRGVGMRDHHNGDHTRRPRYESAHTSPYNSNKSNSYQPQVAEHVHHADAAAPADITTNATTTTTTTAAENTRRAVHKSSPRTTGHNHSKDKRDVVVILEKAGLVLGHRGLVDAYERAASTELANPSLVEVRPDLVHHCLLALYDSDLAYTHRLRVYISLLARPAANSTNNNTTNSNSTSSTHKVIEVSPALRPPRSFARFRSLITALLREGKVSSAEGEVLMRTMPGSIAPIIPFGAEVTGLCNELTAPVMTAVTLAQAAQAAPVSDALQGGVKHVEAFYCVTCNEESNLDGVEYVTRKVCLSAYPMSSAVMCARICHAHAQDHAAVAEAATMASLLPYDFRCLRHIRHLYARNLPVDFSKAHSLTRRTEGQASAHTPREAEHSTHNDDMVNENNVPTHHTSSSSSSLSGASSSSSHSSIAYANDTLQHEADTSTSTTTNSSSSSIAVHSYELCSFFLLLRRTSTHPAVITHEEDESVEVVYRSERCGGTPHPVWAALPGSLVNTHYGALTEFTLELHHQLRRTHNTKNKECSDDRVVREYVWHFAIDTTALRYVAATMSEADTCAALQVPCADDETGFALLFRCEDGVFAYTPHTHTNPSEDETAVMVERERGGTEVAWSRSPGGVGLYEYDHTSQPYNSNAASRVASPRPAGITAAVITSTSSQQPPWLPCSPGSRPAAASHDALNTTNTNSTSSAMTLGDVKTLATGTAVWAWLRRIDDQRRALLLQHTDTLMGSTNTTSCSNNGSAEAVCEAARTAMIEAQLSAAQEQLSLRTIELEQELRMIEDTRHVLAKQERQLASYHENKDENESKEEREAREEHADHVLYGGQPVRPARDTSERDVAELRAQVARTRQAALQQLRGFFPLHLVPDELYCNNMNVRSNTTQTELARDTLCDMPLPFFADPTRWDELNEDTTGVLVRKCLTTAEMHRESVALGYAAQLVRAMATLYAFTLPYPLLIAGAHSRLIAKPELFGAHDSELQRQAEQQITLPLYYATLPERAVLAKAVRLLLFDLAALATCAGREESAVATCGMRVGKALHVVLGSS